MSPPFNRYLHDEVLKVVQNQVRANDPPQTRQTLQRLIAEGYSDQEARRMIGAVLLIEMCTILKENKPHDEVRYVAALNALPTLPGDDEDEET